MAVEIPTGADSPYLASNVGGTGAVIFDTQQPDLLSLHLKNLEGIDKAIEEQKAHRAVAGKVLNTLLADKNPKLDGVYPQDVPYLQELGNDVTKATAALAAYGTPNFQDPNYLKLYQDRENAKTKLASTVGASSSFNKGIHSVGNIFSTGEGKDKYDEADYAQKLADIKATHPSERYGEKYVDPESLLKPRTKGLHEVLSSLVHQSYSKMPEQGDISDVFNKGGYVIQKEHKENFDDATAKEVASSMVSGRYENSKEVVDKAWNELNATNKPQADQYLAQYSNLDPVTAKFKAQQDFVKDQLMQTYHIESTAYKFKGNTPEAKEYAKLSAGEKKAVQQGEWLYKAMKSMFDVNSPNATKFQYQPVFSESAPPVELVGETWVNGKKLGTYEVKETDANGVEHTKQLPNEIIRAGRDEKTGKVFMVTTESQAKARQTHKSTDEFIEVPSIKDGIQLVGSLLKGVNTVQGAFGAAKLDKQNAIVDPATNTITLKTKPTAQSEAKKKEVITKIPLKKVEVAEVKLSPKQWNEKWATLKKGEKLVGLDGKTYTKP
jgi:hypothetical protein